MYKNIRVEQSYSSTWLVRADSERFGKDAIMFEHYDCEKAVEYAKSIGGTDVPVTSRMDLYHAVKHQVSEYQADHGYNLPQLWTKVNQQDATGRFWKDTCLDDYRKDSLRQAV